MILHSVYLLGGFHTEGFHAEGAKGFHAKDAEVFTQRA